MNYIEETYDNEEEESEPADIRRKKNKNQPNTTGHKQPLRNQIKNQWKKPELHNRRRISGKNNAKQPNNIRTEGYPTADRKIPRREQERDQYSGKNLSK